MSRRTVSVTARPPERPELHAGPDADWLLECCLANPAERTTWLVLADRLRETWSSEAEVYRCIRRCQRHAIRCQHVARAVSMLTAGRGARALRLAVGLFGSPYPFGREELPIVVVAGVVSPRPAGHADDGDGIVATRIDVGDAWVRWQWAQERLSISWPMSRASGRGATPRVSG